MHYRFIHALSTNRAICFRSIIMRNVSVFILISVSIWTIVKATCYPQGLCEVGFMDITQGNLIRGIECTADCVGGPYYANFECECACILSKGCTPDAAQSDEGVTDGAITLIVIGSLIGMCIFGCMISLCLTSNGIVIC